MWRVFKFFNKKAWLCLIISVLMLVVQVWLDLRIPDFMSEITKTIQTEQGDITPILCPGGLMLLCALGSLVAAVITGYCAAYMGSIFSYNIRAKFFQQVQAFSLNEINQFSISSLITRSTNDIRQIHMFVVLSVQMLIRAPIMAVIAISKIINKGIEFTTLTAVGVAIIMIVMMALVVIALPRFKRIQSLVDNLNRITRESISGVRVVRAYNAEEFQNDKFAEANSELTNTQLFVERALAILFPVIMSVMSGLSLAIYWIGAIYINEAQLVDKIDIFSNMVVFSSYAIQVIMAFLLLVAVFILYPRANVSFQRLKAVLDTPLSIKNGTLKSDTKKHGVVEFKNVSFKYPDAEGYVFKNISFVTKPGETVAFIGSTGSGKSTLINLIPRFYDATDGQVLIDGVDVKDLDLAHLQDKIGYISQKAFMFKGTIKKNLAFGYKNGQKPTDKQIKKATKIAQADEFIKDLKKGLGASVAQGGTNFSGGQKQRLSIARAIARDPEIYIFDDAFSALDYKTDRELRHDLNEHTKDATKFIVAQRIGTIKEADQIIVLDKGKCVGHGKHADLLKNCPIYREIALSQLSETELEQTA